jgi:hypothetical protein
MGRTDCGCHSHDGHEGHEGHAGHEGKDACGGARALAARRAVPGAMLPTVLATVLATAFPGTVATAREAGPAPESDAAIVRLRPGRPGAPSTAPRIEFSELYVFGPRAPELTAKARSLQGRMVTVVGFMVLLQRPVAGGFYLAAYPVGADESGGGRGDLPPTAILVLPRAAAGREVAYVPGALEVTGVLEVGNRSVGNEPSTVRVLVDDPRHLRFARVRLSARAAHSTKTSTEKTTTENRRAER